MRAIRLPDRRLITWGSLTLAVLVLLFARSMSRFFDLDEHQFVAPGVLLLRQGLRPYIDYAYFHMPYLVYIYAGVLWMAPYQLLLARIVSVICATATAVVLFRSGWLRLADLKERDRWLFVGGLTATFLCSRMFTYASGWAWNHDSVVLVMLLCYLAHREGMLSGQDRWFLLSGLLLGLGTSIRLTAAPAVVPLAAALVIPAFGANSKARLRSLLIFAAGGALASIPSFVLMWEAPDRFVFGNLIYPSIYGAFVQNAGGTTPAGKVWFFLVSMFSDPGNLLIEGIGIFQIVRALARWRDHAAGARLLLPAMIVTLWLGAMTPTQTQYQYGYVLFPFFVLAGFETIAAGAFDFVVLDRWRRLVQVGAAITILTGIPRWYWGVIDLATPRAWVPIEVHATGLWVASQLPPGAHVMTTDPLVPLEGGLDVYPQFATGRFIFHASPLMSSADREKYDMPTGDVLSSLLAREPPGAFLYDKRLEFMVPEFLSYARSHDFNSIDSPDGAYRLWIAPPASAGG